MARDNRTLGRFHLDGIPPAPRGVPQIEVTFDIDANGILNVSAKDMATGKSQQITITASSGLGKDEVDRMVRDAESHAEDDKRRRELVDLRNQADSLAYNLEKLLNENREKVGESQAREIEEAVAEARKAAEGEDATAMRAAMDKLTKLSHRVAESLYKTATPPPGGPADGPGPEGPAERQAGGGGEGDVVDAEYTVKN
jgi:molecular chaperone DnaK